MTAAEADLAAENARLRAALSDAERARDEALEQQAATAEVLQVIGSSPADVQPVFEAILQAAARLFDSSNADLWEVDGDRLRCAATIAHAHIVQGQSVPLERDSMTGRAIAERRTVHVPDVAASLAEFPNLSSGFALFGDHSLLAVPLVRDGVPVGVLVVGRMEGVRPFSDKEIALSELFAAQAVIAMTNAQMFNEREQRNRELSAALDRQSASAEILEAISTSPTDPTRALGLITASARRLIQADGASLRRLKGDQLVLVGAALADGVGAVSGRRVAVPLAEASPAASAVRDRRTIHLPDMAAALDTFPQLRPFVASGRRTAVYIPLLYEGRAIGVFALSRAEARAFAPAEIGLAEAFANQAAIALENARVYGELDKRNRDLSEALEQQTATAEILSIISTSPTDLQPVFAAVAERAQQLLGCEVANVVLRDGDTLRFVAATGPSLIRTLQHAMPHTLPLTGGPIARVLLDARVLHMYGTPDEIAHEYPGHAALWREAGYERHAGLWVPLLHNGIALGAIGVGRADGVPFTERQIALLETFAAQVVIAMQNTRLFNELQQSNANLREALEQQTATAGVLQAISRSAFDLPAVLNLLTEQAVRLCHADAGFLNRVVNGALLMQAAVGVPADRAGILPAVPVAHPDPRSIVGQALITRRTVHVPDLAVDPQLAPTLETWERVGLGHRTRLGVPLLRAEEVIGCLGLWRAEVSPFSAQEIALVEMFADQAVIAIENSRLIEEIREKSRQLEEASRHKSAFLSAMSHELRTPLNAVIGYSEILAEDAQDARNEAILPDLEKINAAGKHLLSLISNVLDLSKIEAGRMDLAIEDFAIDMLLAEVEAVVPPLIDKNGNRFVIDVSGDLGAMHTDKTKLRQSLLNLLSNAAKFTEQGEITLSVQRDSGWLSFAVSDSGIGMTEEQLGRLFTAFTQAEAGTSVRYGGTGLGLALSREFCRLLGGDISVVSEPGRGSTFTLRVPAAVAAAPTG